MRRTSIRSLLGGAAAFVTAAALSLGGATAAVAAPADPPATTDVVITKAVTPTGTSSPADGLPHTIGEGIAGAQFTLTLIEGTEAGGASSTLTNAGQQAAQQRAVAADGTVTGGTLSSTTIVSGATGADGAVTLTDVPAGQYLVTETQTPAGAAQSVPFLLTLPLTHPTERDDWLTTVYVYPKSSRITASKSVDELDGRAVGDTVAWTILTGTPQMAPGTLTSFVISDQLADRLALDGAPVVSFADDAIAAANPLAEGTHYSVTSEAGLVTVSFLASGLRVLEQVGTASPSSMLSVVLPTRVSATQAPLSGTISNFATITQNGQLDQALTTDPATIVFSDLVVEKQDSLTGDLLGGAAFQLYRSEADAQAGANPISIGEVDTWTTADGTGRLTIPGLLRSDFVDGVITSDAAQFASFWLVETQAPAAHQLLAQPVEVQVVLDGDAPRVWVVQNVPTSGGFLLPLTGGTGTLLLTFAGIALVIVVLLIARRRRSNVN